MICIFSYNMRDQFTDSEAYMAKVRHELAEWGKEQEKRPNLVDKWALQTQAKINSYIPVKVHVAITVAIQQMVKAVLFGSQFTSKTPLKDKGLIYRELLAKKEVKAYRQAATIEGGVTGAGGLLMGLADFPLFFSIKMKMLYAMAAIYGFDTNSYKERLYLLYIFQLAFSNKEESVKIYHKIVQWNNIVDSLPVDINEFDWYTFQQQYRDYLDLAKLAQLLPVVGALVGVVANYRLIGRLAETAKQAFRYRLLQKTHP